MPDCIAGKVFSGVDSATKAAYEEVKDQLRRDFLGGVDDRFTEADKSRLKTIFGGLKDPVADEQGAAFRPPTPSRNGRRRGGVAAKAACQVMSAVW